MPAPRDSLWLLALSGRGRFQNPAGGSPQRAGLICKQVEFAVCIPGEAKDIQPQGDDNHNVDFSETVRLAEALRAQNLGAAHAMELPFVFGTVNRQEVIVFTGRNPARYKLSEITMDTWAAFARTGNPALSNGPSWPTFDAKSRATMERGPVVRLVYDPLGEQRRLWGDTFPTSEQAQAMLTSN